MPVTQIRINYHGSPAILFRQLLAPLQAAWRAHYFDRWTLSRGWQNGPHILMSLDADDPFFEPTLVTQAEQMIAAFLAAYPSPAYDEAQYLQTQARLKQLESADMDPGWVHGNNSQTLNVATVTMLAQRYESTAQWLSLYEAEVALRPILIAQWRDHEKHDAFLHSLLTLLACAYPPKPSDDPEVNEYNGFLSFHSNFRFWLHGLSPAQQATIGERFERDYQMDKAGYVDRLVALLQQLETGGQGAVEAGESTGMLTRWIMTTFLQFTRLAANGVIHARSPYPREQLAPPAAVSDFHRRFFYGADGSANQFNHAFSGYRWLLNIVYRTLPLLDVSPLRRQYLNYSLDQMQREQEDLVRQVRQAMLTY